MKRRAPTMTRTQRLAVRALLDALPKAQAGEVCVIGSSCKLREDEMLVSMALMKVVAASLHGSFSHAP